MAESRQTQLRTGWWRLPDHATTELNCATAVYHPGQRRRYPTLRPHGRHRTPRRLSSATPQRRYLGTPVRPRARPAAFDPPLLVPASTRPRSRPGTRRLPRLAVRTDLRPPTLYRRPLSLLSARAVRPAAVVGFPPARGSGPRGCRFPGCLPGPPGATGARRRHLCPQGAATLGHGDGAARNHGGGGRNLPPGVLSRRP